MRLTPSRTVSAALVFAVCFGVYAFYAYPTFAPRDSADMAAAALTLGVAHPPGYPLYSLLGRLWISLLPLGDPAYRLNLLSSWAGAGAAALVFLLARRRLAALPALLVSLSFAFCAPLWKFSSLSEMYSLHALFAAALLLLAEGEPETEARRAAASGFLFGLGVVNHQTLVLLAPALLWLWRGALARRWKAIAVWLAAGLSLELFVLVRLADAPLAWRVLARADYGVLTLFSGFSSAGSAGGEARLVWASLAGLAAACPLAALAPAGSWLGRSRRSVQALGLALLAFGPFYFALTRFSLETWVARTVLEPSYLIPALAGVLLAVEALAALPERLASSAGAAALAATLALHSGAAFHRDDFLAYDYVKDLRRRLPPGSALVVQGDTALFGLRYLGSLDPEAARTLRSTLDDDNPGWVAARLSRSSERPVFAAGMPAEQLETLAAPAKAGLAVEGPLVRLVPAGARPEPSPGFELDVLRRGASFERRETYARDVVLARAFARYLTGRLLARAGLDPTFEYVRAALLDPEEYKIEWQPAKTYNQRRAGR